MFINSIDFQESITKELEIIKNRVRYLIGNRHWGEEGRFKEAVLKNILKRFLPNNISVGTGFIIDSSDGNEISRQLDIILYDNTKPVLFSEGDFIITTKSNVRGIIEVKSRITTSSLSKVIKQFDESISMIQPFDTKYQVSPNVCLPELKKVFLGIFAFDFEGDVDNEEIGRALISSSQYVNHISLGSKFFIRKWKREEGCELEPPIYIDSDFYNVYNLVDLSYSYFISNLIDTVSDGLNDRYWFSFPIEGTKETRRIRTINLPCNY